jgi:hypothetical protein
MRSLKHFGIWLVVSVCAVQECPAAEFYSVGGDYIDSTVPFKGAVWANSGNELSKYEYKVRFLLQTDKTLKEHLNRTGKLLEEAVKAKNQETAQSLSLQVHQLMAISEDLDKVLVTEFWTAKSLLASHENTSLLKMMLCHYHLFVNSQNANWPKVIVDLEALDPTLAAIAKQESNDLRNK